LKAGLLAVIWVAALAGCTAPAPPAAPTNGLATETIYLVRRSWHTDIGVPVAEAGPELNQLQPTFPGVKVWVVGFGERAWLLARDHGFGDMVTAIVPSAGALLVTALRTDPQVAFPDHVVVELHVSRAGLARLDDFVDRSFVWPKDGAPRAIADGPYPGSLFYASTMTYSGLFTCNTWTAEGLQTSGLPIDTPGALFADQVEDQARRAGTVVGPEDQNTTTR
jgi:uncharacterized protein (TIGR02117 family)